MKKVFVLGSINIDNVAYTRVLPQPGITVEGDSFLSNIGGKGANQACAAHFLGADVTYVGAVGKDDNGVRVEKFFDSLGLKYHLVKSEKSTGTALIIIDEGTAENRILCVPGANFDIHEKDIDPVLDMMQEGDILLLQLECLMDTVAYAVRKAKEKGLTVVMNPAPYRNNIPDDCFKNIDYFIPNEHELDSYIQGDKDYIQKSLQILAKGVKNVIVTLGDKGSLLVNKDGVTEVKPHKVNAVDTTAAGDSYCGAFVTALSKGKSVKEAIDFASLCSSITVTRKGAINSLPKLEEVNH